MADVINMVAPSAHGGELASVSSLSSAPGPMVMNGDTLILSLTTSDATGVVGIRGRLLRVDGEVVPFAHTMTFSGTGTQTDVVCPLTAGWIIGFDVSRDSGTLTDGEVAASVHIGRNVGALQQKLICLASGDVTDIRSLGLGAFTSVAPTSGSSSGTPTTTLFSDPAAGAEFTTTVPSGQTWALQSLRLLFTASATVATREPTILFDDGANVFLRQPAPSGSIANAAHTYQLGTMGSTYTPAVSGSKIWPIPIFTLPAGTRITTLTSNIQVGDQYSACCAHYILT